MEELVPILLLMARDCVFCGCSPVTAEHVWPAWFRRLSGEVKMAFPHELVAEAEGETSEKRNWNQPPFSLTVKRFCANCNNGWMSGLESAAERLLSPLLERGGRFFHRREQRELASWALLKAIVLDQTHADQAIPDWFIERLFEDKQPPEQVAVWTTVWTADLPAIYSYQGAAVAPGDAMSPQEEPNVFSVTFTLGPLVFQVAGSLVDGLGFDDIVYPQLDICRLWPYKTGQIDFAPRKVMTRKTLELFATAIFDDLQKEFPPGDRIEPVRGPN